ncbi:MAG: carbon-nitrogen family hydrolase [Selenomonas sp.]|nr:carbon-nitrogen family hydrolase [Selenomonas sp.]
MKISIFQMHTILGQPEKNTAAFLRMAEQAMQEKPDVLLLPEMWNIGFFPRPVEDYADKNGENTRALLSEFARKNQVNIVGGSIARLESSTGKIYNTCYIFDRHGQEIAAYDKVHLFSPGKENQVFEAGRNICTFTLDGHKCGAAICYDLRFGNYLSRVAEDVEILFLPAAWPKLRQKHWDILTQARAIEYQVFVAACNGGATANDKHPLGGHSGIFDPWGEMLAKAGEGEDIISAEVDFGLLPETREKIPVRIDKKVSL